MLFGLGSGGIYQAKVMAETGKSFVVFDRYHKIGGVWEFYGNEYSRVNTSEMLGPSTRGCFNDFQSDNSFVTSTD